MALFSQLLIGGFWVGGVSFVSWLIGLLMGVALTKLATAAPAKHQDVADLLKRQWQTAAAQPAAAAVAGPGASSQS